MRALLVMLSLVSFSVSAFDGQVTRFKWNADRSIEVGLKFSGGGSLAIRGEMREGDRSIMASSGGVMIWVKAYGNSQATVTVAEPGAEWAGITLMRAQNAEFLPVNKKLIRGRAVSAGDEVDGVVAALRKANGWDESTALDALVGYFQVNPKATLGEFFDAVEVGHVKTVPRVKTPERNSIETGDEPATADPETRLPPKRKSRTEARPQDEERPERPRRRQRPPQPRWEPYYPSAPWAPWQPSPRRGDSPSMPRMPYY